MCSYVFKKKLMNDYFFEQITTLTYLFYTITFTSIVIISISYQKFINTIMHEVTFGWFLSILFYIDSCALKLIH